MRCADALAQRATLGAEHLISQRRPRESMLHDVVPLTLPTPSRLLLVVVLIVTLTSLRPLVLLLLVLVLLLTLLLEVQAAACPVATKQAARASVGRKFMVRLRVAAKKRGRSPFRVERVQEALMPLNRRPYLSFFLSLLWPFALPWPRLPGPSPLMSLLTPPALSAAVPPAPAPAAATPPMVEVALPLPLVPAWVLLVVPVFWLALVLWLVVAFGLMVTLLCGIARKVASVFTDVLACGETDWLALVLVVLPARFLVVPFLADVVPVPVPAWVLLVVAVFWVAAVVWLVVPLGLMVTVLCGIALKLASVFTVVLAVGATDWVAWVPVVLVAVLLVVCAMAPPAKRPAIRMLSSLLISLSLVGTAIQCRRCIKGSGPCLSGSAPSSRGQSSYAFRREPQQYELQSQGVSVRPFRRRPQMRRHMLEVDAHPVPQRHRCHRAGRR